MSHVGVLFNPTVVTTTAEVGQATAAAVARLEARVAFLPVRDAVDQVGAFEAAFAAVGDAGLLAERLGIPSV